MKVNTKMQPSSPSRKLRIHARIQKVLSERVQLWLLFEGRGEIGFKYHYKRSIIGPPAKRHFMAYRWRAVDGLTLNAGLAGLWFFRGSWPVLLWKLIFCDFSGRGSRPPVPPLDPRMVSVLRMCEKYQNLTSLP